MIIVSRIVTEPTEPTSATTVEPTPATTKQLRGDVLEVVRELLAERGDDVVLDIVQRVVRELEEVKRRLAEKQLRRAKGAGIASSAARFRIT